MKRIAVLVSGGGTNLQALIDAQARGELGGEIAAVISSKAGAYALERAKNAGIPGYVLPRKEFASNQAMTIAQWGNIPERDMFNTYNMGVGMSVVVPAEQVDTALEILKAHGEDAYVIGSIIESEEKVILE